MESRSPQRPDDVVVRIAATDAESVRRTINQSRQAQRAWAATSASDRSAALTAAADAVARSSGELIDLAVREVGKPVAEGSAEVARSESILRYYAQQIYDPIGSVHEPSAGGMLFTRRRPHGVAGLITPWNFPFAIPIWKAAPALAFGNTVVLKPAPQAIGCALLLQEILQSVLPSNVLQLVIGDADTGAALVDLADAVSFTGSTGAGRIVAGAAARRGVPVQAEMGGQNPAIVLPDADMRFAATQICAAAMGYAGQKCTATKRVIVVGDPAEFRDAFVAATDAVVVGDPADPGVTIGPVIDRSARDRIASVAGSVQSAGGRILTRSTVTRPEGWYVAPTIAEGVGPAHVLARDEVFGPICLLISVASLDQAVAVANDVDFGLVASLFTSDLAAALDVPGDLEVGMVKINAPTTGVDFYTPFGGDKASSVGGREQGRAAQDFYTSTQTVTVRAR